MSSQINDIPEGFKMTELGLLPEDWKVVQVDEVIKLSRGISWSKSDESVAGVPVVAIPNVKEGRVNFDFRYRISKNISDEKILRAGDILLVGSSGSIHNVGRTALVPEIPFAKLTFASFLIKASPSAVNIDHSFSFYLLRGGLIDYAACSKRAADGKFNLQVDEVRHYLIPLPLLTEQKAIARVLSTIQKAIETQDKIIAATRELKKSLMGHLFTYGPVPVAEAEHVLLKETEIGPVPEHWETARLEQLMRLRTENVLPEDVPGIRYVGLEHMDSGEINLQRWGRTEQVRSAKSRFYQTDILYGKLRPYLDKAALAEWEGVCSTDILVFTAYNETALPDYLAGLLHTRLFIEHAISTTSGVNHPRTSWSSIKNFVTPCPPISEQQEIARILSTVDSKIESEENRKAALQALFKTMLHQLMTGKVRVKYLEATAA